jgi:5-methylcytosine-specific restriction enzyme subunit McrC
MNRLTVFEFETVTSHSQFTGTNEGIHSVPDDVYSWLESEALRASISGQQPWLRLTQRRGLRAIQFTSFVGIIRAPNGFQIEVLPKVGRAIGGSATEARQLLIEMLCSLQRFRHVKTENAKLLARRLPLYEVFIAEFLRATETVVKRGVHSGYTETRDNLFALRGKIVMASHLRQNLVRADRFFAEFDHFTTDRPENRLLHSSLLKVLEITSVAENQKLARSLAFTFSDVPVSANYTADFQRVQKDRSMAHYEAALDWARLILVDESPIIGSGANLAPSLLFPVQELFEAFVAKHLKHQLADGYALRSQASNKWLVNHQEQVWFRMKPDLLIVDRQAEPALVLDTKWKLIDSFDATRTAKYGLAQQDFYQLMAYGHSYMGGEGSLVLIYPKTQEFNQPLPVFEFMHATKLKLWVLPFCLTSKTLALPQSENWDSDCFRERYAADIEHVPAT